MVIIVHKFDLSLVINEKKKLGHAVIETRVFERIYMFSPDRGPSVKGPYPRRAGQLRSLE